MEPLYDSGDSEPQGPWREIRNFSLQLLALGLALHSYVHWQFSAASNLFCEAKISRRICNISLPKGTVVLQALARTLTEPEDIAPENFNT